MEAPPHLRPRLCPGCLHRNQRVFKAFPFFVKTSAFPSLFLLPGRVGVPANVTAGYSQEWCWLRVPIPTTFWGGLWPNWERCGQHPHPRGHPILGASLVLGDTPSLGHPYSRGHPSLGTPHPCGRSILGDAPSLWSLHPLGHPSLGSPLFPHTYCQRPFLLRVFLEAARPQGWAQGSSPWYGELLCSIALPSPIPQAFCPLFFSFSFKNFSGSNDCLSTQVN